MHTQEALVPSLASKFDNRFIINLATVALGVLLLAGLAQISIHLPWTPVPITGQTFGVTLIALTWGRKQAPLIMALYLGLGAVGLPIFAAAQSGLAWGPTLGYLAGMFVASFVVGELADRGASNSFKKSLAAGFIGSLIVYAFGLCVLSFFIPKNSLLMAGFIPFLPGDIIKTTLAAYIATRMKVNFAKS